MMEIIEVAIMETYKSRYAFIHYIDGTVVKTETVSQDVLDFIDNMINENHFDIILSKECSCVKFNKLYRFEEKDFFEKKDFDLIVSSDLEVRVDEHLTQTFDKFFNGNWYKATGYRLFGPRGFSLEYKIWKG